MTDIHVLFHFPCPDGFGSAWSMFQYFTKYPPTGEYRVTFQRESHRWETTKSLLAKKDLSKKIILYFDICPTLDLLEEIHSKAATVLVYDHHKSAMEECGHLDYCYFDMKRSGAGIAWDEFMGRKGEKRPFMIDLIEDQDLWKWEIPDAGKYLVVMETFKYDFDEWTTFAARLETPEGREEILKEGTAMDAYRRTVVRRLVAGKIHKLTVGGHVLPAVNASVLQSPVGNILAKKGPAGAVYYTQGKKWNFSLRSTDEGLDVSVIAKQYGGGGHRNAAGFSIPTLEDLAASDIKMEDYTETEMNDLLSDLDVTAIMSTEPLIVLQ